MISAGTSNTPKVDFAKVLINSGVMLNMSSQWSVKRVPLDFDWPVGYVWHGYINPWPGPIDCEKCKGAGCNDETQKLYRNFRRWAPRITEEEANLAIKAGLSSKDIEHIRNRSWESLLDDPLPRSYLTEIRAKITGVWGLCHACNGKQKVPNPNPAVQLLYADVNLFEEWKPIEPLKGEGWQLWQLREEGGFPASEVHKSDTDLAK